MIGEMKVPYRLGVDTGGTFTDIAVVAEGSGDLHVAKIPSTPANPSRAVLEGLKEVLGSLGLDPKEISFFIHGTTVATNALLEHRGAKTALITTQGFRDVLHIGRQNRPKLYDFWARRAEPLVPRSLRFEVGERTLHDGSILTSLDQEEVRMKARELKEQGVESVAVCLLNAFANPGHETLIGRVLNDEMPGTFITLSSEVLPEFREYERMSTVVINAYVMPRVATYVQDLRTNLAGLGLASDLYIMQSNGGVITAPEAKKVSARTVLSGPAGGVLAGLFVSRLCQRPNVITVDMGGTSLDVSLIHQGKLLVTTEGEIGGYPMKLPMIEINTIGAGGGSVAWIDQGGALRVGPHSAGAEPGPVCYGQGGQAVTVTDANVVLGRLNPEYLLGGRMPLERALAFRAVESQIAAPAGMTPLQAAEGIIRVVNANMVRGIRVVSVEKGYDVRQFSLVVFGGAGPVHGAQLAQELGIPEVIVPPHPGVTSAMGMLVADVRHDFVRTVVGKVESLSASDLRSEYQGLEGQARAQLEREGFRGSDMQLLMSADTRYAGQAYELNVPISRSILEEGSLQEMASLHHGSHQRQYGYSLPREPVELVNLRLTAFGRLPEFQVTGHRRRLKEEKVGSGERKVIFDGEEIMVPVFPRDHIDAGYFLRGPAIIEQMDSTIVVFPGQWAASDQHGNLVIRQGEEAAQ
jgi:N-methylhydantoinase A